MSSDSQTTQLLNLTAPSSVPVSDSSEIDIKKSEASLSNDHNSIASSSEASLEDKTVSTVWIQRLFCFRDKFKRVIHRFLQENFFHDNFQSAFCIMDVRPFGKFGNACEDFKLTGYLNDREIKVLTSFDINQFLTLN